MKILVIADIQASGEWIATRRFLDELKKINPSLMFRFEDLHRFKLTFLKFPLGTIRSFIRDVFYMYKLVLWDSSIGAVLSTNFVSCTLAILKYKKQKPIIHYFHGWRSSYLVNPKKRTLQERFMFFLEKWIIKQSDMLLVPSKFTKEQMVKILGRKKKIFIVPRLLPDYYFKPQSKKAPKKYFLYSGRIASYKGIENLVKSFENISDRNITLVIASPREGVDKNIYEEIQNGKNIEFLWDAPENHMPALYHESIACVLPSETENAPLVMFEAFASGAVFLGSGAGDMAEHLSNIDQRLIVSTESLGSSLEWVYKLLPDERKKIIDKSKKYAFRYVKNNTSQLQQVWTRLEKEGLFEKNTNE